MKSFEKFPKSHAQFGCDTENWNMRQAEAAQYTGLSESTLAKLRMRHKRDEGPRFLKISGCVIYRRSDLDAWMNRHVVGGAKNE